MTDPLQFSEVLQRLICALVDDPRSVTLDCSELKGRRNFGVGCDVNDCGKLVGSGKSGKSGKKGGHRLRALRLICEIAGRQLNEVWWLDQPANPTGERYIGRTPAEIPESHNPERDFELLKDLLTNLGINATVAVSGSVNEGFTFTVVPALMQDETALIEPYDAHYAATQQETQPLCLRDALKNIFMAIGGTQGVRYKLETR